MGEPVRIHDLAKMMIQLSGLVAADDDSPGGDVEIVEIGLRPGEKIHEELLIDNQALSTSHPRIVKSNEAGIALATFDELFRKLLQTIDEREVEASLALVKELVSAESAGERPRTTSREAKKQASKKQGSRAAVRRTANLPPLPGKAAFGA